MEQRRNVIKEKSFEFAKRTVLLSRFLIERKREYVISKQILRSGTSIGANIEEADGAISRKEFSSKISISYKEAKETHYWLRLLYATGYISGDHYESLIEDCNEICKILFSILKTTRISRQIEN